MGSREAAHFHLSSKIFQQVNNFHVSLLQKTNNIQKKFGGAFLITLAIRCYFYT